MSGTNAMYKETKALKRLEGDPSIYLRPFFKKIRSRLIYLRVKVQLLFIRGSGRFTA